MPRSGAGVVGAELIDGMDLNSGLDMRMERSRSGRRGGVGKSAQQGTRGAGGDARHGRVALGEGGARGVARGGSPARVRTDVSITVKLSFVSSIF